MAPGSPSPSPRDPRLVGLVFAALAVAFPLVAHALGPEGELPVARRVLGDVQIVSFPGIVVIGTAVLVVAFLTNRFAPKKRRHMGNTSIAALLYVVSYGATWIMSLAKAPAPAAVAHGFCEFFGLLTAINLIVLVVFDLGLSTLRVTSAPFLSSLMVVIGNVAAVVITMRELGVEISSILATSALLSGILSFSLQGTLANIVGGAALQIDDSIKVGDWVQLENGRQGKVREIRWRFTVIETRDWDTMIVPNATLLASTVTILGKREGQPIQHRMWVYFNVDFRFSPADVVEAVNTALQAAPIEGVAGEPKPHAICFDFAKDGRDSFAYYAVRYWLTDLARDDPTSSKVRERIFTALKRADIPLAMPAAHVWVEQDAENRARRKQVEAERRRSALDGVSFLKALHDEERAHVAERLRYALFAPGETITKQGAVAHWLYIIVTGVAEVRVNIEGSDKTVAKIQAPGFVGEMGLMTGEPRTATVVAVTEVECYRLDKEGFNKIMVGRPEIAAEISHVLASRTVELQAVREDLDADSKRRALEAEHHRLMTTIQGFFGLDEENPPSTTQS
jgi:small-conductance mechanosensitive channel/CRP-like cAMP-binding protein